MSRRHKVHFPNDLYFVTLTIVGWIDIFTRREYCDLIIENLKYCKEHKGLTIYAYVIMSNHIHMIARCDEPKGLSLVLADFKSYTAKKILEIVYSAKESRKDWMIHVFKFYAKLRKGHQEHMVWEPGSHPIHLYSKKVILQKLNYIHENPRAAGLINAPEYWSYSSCSNYAGMPSVMEVTLLDEAYQL